MVLKADNEILVKAPSSSSDFNTSDVSSSISPAESSDRASSVLSEGHLPPLPLSGGGLNAPVTPGNRRLSFMLPTMRKPETAVVTAETPQEGYRYFRKGVEKGRDGRTLSIVNPVGHIPNGSKALQPLRRPCSDRRPSSRSLEVPPPCKESAVESSNLREHRKLQRGETKKHRKRLEVKHDEAEFVVADEERKPGKVASLSKIAKCLIFNDTRGVNAVGPRKLTTSKWEHEVSVYIRLCNTHIKQAFMNEFWAMYYHYPLNEKRKAGDGIQTPAPSSRDRCPSPLEIANRRTRITTLSVPKFVTRKREEVLLQSESTQTLPKPQPPPTNPCHLQSHEKSSYSSSQKLHGRRNRSHSPVKQADHDWNTLISFHGNKPYSPPDSLRRSRFERHSDIQSAGRRALRNVQPRASTVPASLGRVSFFSANDSKFTPEAKTKTTLCESSLKSMSIDSIKKRKMRPSSAFPAQRLPSVVRPKGQIDDLNQDVMDASDLDLSGPMFFSFNDLMGKAPKILKGRVYDVIAILRKQAFQRTPEEIKLVHLHYSLEFELEYLIPTWFWSIYIQAFRKINSDFIFTQLCTKATIQEFPRGTIVFNQGDDTYSPVYIPQSDPGEAWHVVLMGRVNVLVSKGFDLQRKSIISVLGCGEAFGSQALVNDGPRTATVVCETPTWLMRVGKMDYKNLLGFLHMIEQKEIIHFLRHRVPLFQFFETPALRNVTERLSLRSYAPNTVIIHEGEMRDHIFIIKSGISSPPPHHFLGNLVPGAHFNEDVITDPHNYSGCPFTVVAIDQVECGTVGAVGEWTNMTLNIAPSKFAGMSMIELVRSRAMEVRKR
ncbi:hypothetical protein HDU67_003041 [Dinochytrium kinnereticum]|nr:hypothetical protein HDU67_003041 [Dinochytrium kinnereticum]